MFGVRKSADTRAALRFFAERRVKVHFVDLNERAAAVGELRRFAQKFGVTALIDRESRRFGELGLGAARLSDERWLEKLSLELLNLSIHEVNNVWSILGAKYMPSIVYKVRMLAVQENWIAERVPTVTAPASKVTG